jgi:predicted component of type VI protein secretion system
VLLIVMFEAGTWRVRPGEKFTFGRAKTCSLVLPDDDRGVSRTAGSFESIADSWWLANDSASSMLYLQGDRGFRADLPPGMRMPLQQWHAKVRVDGVHASYTIRLRLPHLDDEDHDELDEPAAEPDAVTAERILTSTRLRAPLNDDDRLVLAARFEEYLTWRHSGAAQPRSARDTAERIGWQAHTVTKRCENIRNRYVRIGVPGLRGPRALEELAALLISTGELSGEDLRRLPPKPAPEPETKPPASG